LQQDEVWFRSSQQVLLWIPKMCHYPQKFARSPVSDVFDTRITISDRLNDDQKYSETLNLIRWIRPSHNPNDEDWDKMLRLSSRTITFSVKYELWVMASDHFLNGYGR
jgi:hypothetical protein